MDSCRYLTLHNQRRRNAIAYNPNRTCTKSNNELIPHILSMKPIPNITVRFVLKDKRIPKQDKKLRGLVIYKK